MEDSLRFIVATPPNPPPINGPDVWWARYRILRRRFPEPAHLALCGGFLADRLAWVAATAYQTALRTLIPDLPPEALTAVAAIEDGGDQPRHILTGLRRDKDGLRLEGHKPLITLGASAKLLLVVLRQGLGPSGQPILRVARVPIERQGVTLGPGPRVGFAPELSHISCELVSVAVHDEELLPGDGWTDFAKPLRTLEDAHFQLALLGYLTQVARRSGWPLAVRDELIALTVASLAVCQADPEAATTHLALGAVEGQLRLLLRRLGPPYWQRVDTTLRARWERDRPLLEVAGKSRAARLAKARQTLEGPA